MFIDPSNPMQTQIVTGLQQITDAVERWTIPLAAIGTVSMAFIQAAKNVAPIWSRFQRRQLRKWLEASFSDRYEVNKPCERGKADPSEKEVLGPLRGAEQAAVPGGEQKTAPKAAQATTPGTQQETAPKPKDQMVKGAQDDLISLATSDDDDAFYALPIEGSCDQIRKVVSVILDYPNIHEDLLYLLARGADGEDIKQILKTQSVNVKDAAFREYAAAKSRVLVQLRCSIDAIQASIGYRWKFWLHLFSMILSGVLGVIALDLGTLAAEKGTMSKASTVLMSVVIGILAGLLAPVARDLVAAIEKWRS